MVSFLQNLKLSTEGPTPEHLGSIRIVVVGDSGVGKTSLLNYITTGKPVRGARSTAGCQVSVKLIEQQAQDSIKVASLGSSTAQSKFFVEFWDVSGHEHYAALRQVFYKQINGVILVYDVANRSSLRRLQRWAMEVATEGSFVAPFSEDLASRNIGGLPVPVLVIGTKSDRLRTSPNAPTTTAQQPCSSTEAVTQLCTGWLKRSKSSGLLLRQRVRPSDNNLAELEKHVQGLHASAVTGQIDWETLNSFFSTLWLRRYQPATGGTNTPTFIQQLQARAGAAAAGGGGGHIGVGRQDMDRLDDDWV